MKTTNLIELNTKNPTESLFYAGGTVNYSFILFKHKIAYHKINKDNFTPYNLYNIYEQVVNTVYYCIKNDFLYIINNTGCYCFEINPCFEYTYKFSKYTIKAINGAEGLIDNIQRFSSPESAFNCSFFTVINKTVCKYKQIKTICCTPIRQGVTYFTDSDI